MTTESLKNTLKRELPTWLKEDPEFRAYILDLTRQEYAPRAETGDRFYQLLGDLRGDREEQTRKWEAQTQEWKARHQRWEAQERKWEAQTQEWKAQHQRWEAQDTKWEAQQEQWKAQNAKWEAQQEQWKAWERKWETTQAETWAEFRRIHAEIMAQARKHERSIGALGSRWGTQSEQTFRDALAGILEQSFGVEVLRVNEYDDSGTVFGRPEQVELDVIVKNGVLLICELKSSIDKAGMYIFERKARFYEPRHQRKADRLIVISPMIDSRARKVAEKLGIETYGDSLEVTSL